MFETIFEKLNLTHTEGIILVVLLSLLAFCIISLIVCSIGLIVTYIQLNSKWCWKRWDKRYMKKHGMNQYWDIFIKHWKEYKPYAFGDKAIYFSWNDRYDIVVWKINGKYETSVHIHDKSDCVLSPFNKEKSEKLAKLLVENWNGYFVKYNV